MFYILWDSWEETGYCWKQIEVELGIFYKLRLLNIFKYEWAVLWSLGIPVLVPAMHHPALTSDGLAFNSSNLNEAAALIRVIC